MMGLRSTTAALGNFLLVAALASVDSALLCTMIAGAHMYTCIHALARAWHAHAHARACIHACMWQGVHPCLHAAGLRRLCARICICVYMYVHAARPPSTLRSGACMLACTHACIRACTHTCSQSSCRSRLAPPPSSRPSASSSASCSVGLHTCMHMHAHACTCISTVGLLVCIMLGGPSHMHAHACTCMHMHAHTYSSRLPTHPPTYLPCPHAHVRMHGLQAASS